ncbi:MAG: hypothetical protein ACI8TE_000534, partial [Francisella sp.]
ETAYTQRDEVKREEHLQNISQLDSNKLVFVDETGTDDNICALYGYSEIGECSPKLKMLLKSKG